MFVALIPIKAARSGGAECFYLAPQNIQPFRGWTNPTRFLYKHLGPPDPSTGESIISVAVAALDSIRRSFLSSGTPRARSGHAEAKSTTSLWQYYRKIC